MESELFKAGLRPGGPTSRSEVKMLICYILANLGGDNLGSAGSDPLGEPMLFADLHEALLENGLVNYFDLVDAVDGLLESGHLRCEGTEGGERYSVTPLGADAGQEFAASLPRSVREKAVASAETILRRRKREESLEIDIRTLPRGYEMRLAIPEQGGHLVSFTVFLPTRAACEQVRRRFLNDPVFIYKSVLALLTGEREVLGELLPEREELF